MDPIAQLDHILPKVSDLVDGIETRQLDDPTPCDEFRVADVLDHMIVLGGSFAEMFRGRTPTEAPTPVPHAEVPAASFRAAMDDLLEGARSEGAMARILPTPLGEMDGETFARVVAFDGLMHGWDLAVASGQPYPVDPVVIAEVDGFARQALSDEMRDDLFAWPTAPPADASALEVLAAFSGRTLEDRWRNPTGALHIDKYALPAKIAIPGAAARQVTGFGDVTGYSRMAGEFFSLGEGTDIAPLLQGLEHDACHAPHWGYMISGTVVVSFVDGSEATCRGGEIFYWPPGHSVRVTDNSEVILFSPQTEHVEVLDHMLDAMATA